ncbi:3-oxoacyl-[acyl-carrier-protein] synthase-1 [Natronospira proteinivora]|uniref:3-oxoacyl-[acyl-carrier-protein] synthase-1 n=1 Tax=Natronospira proteinivora TaxID=1807133 RepID=A0ABT1GBQ4_9GAMM|nr:beta-ketoacyl-[acyl-carrier-protein] synthase family protein [Natronospira proteinivora]MCP1727718.1 3-oxoacyl-[acyl-carrier-protein] synthase-1 [Natronospira proteinivora]
MSSRIYLNHLGLINPLGRDKASVTEAMLAGTRHGLSRRMPLLRGGEATVGACSDELPAVPEGWTHRASRNNRLLLGALQEIESEVQAAIERHGPDRVAVVLGSSTSGVREGEAAVASHQYSGQYPAEFDYRLQEVGSPSEFLAEYLAVSGPALTLSTACTSSSKALIAGARMLELGLCDVVVAGGADSLCDLTVNGFDALESVSAQACNPFSRNRDGINIGEAAALFLMSRAPGPLRLMGWGECSDAHHISAPDPDGVGAEQAMRLALAMAGCDPVDIAYLNLHGTGTMKNDLMESHAVARVFPGGVPASSSKGMVGHTLGAAGATEAAFCWLALHEAYGGGQLPPHVWDGENDPSLAPLDLVSPGGWIQGQHRLAMSNSFAFGGSNAVLLLGAD